MTKPSPRGLDNPSKSFALTLAVAMIALSWQLGVRGLNEPDEGRYASVAWTMLQGGDWVVPHFQGVPHLTKPPLMYWLTALCFKWGGVNEWSARLVPALAALGTLLLTWSLGARWWGPRHGFYAVLLLLTAPLFFVVARLCDPNMLLTFWVTLGFWSWVRWRDDGRPYQRALYYLAHGLAFLTKGPVGCILILLGQLAFRLAGPRVAPARRLLWWPGVALAAGLGLSWYLLMVAQQPDRLDYFVRYELLDRVFTNVHKRGEPFWFFVWVLPVAFLPWLPALAPAFSQGWRSLRTRHPEAGLALQVVFITVFFSISRSKLPTYILPALPPLALLTAGQIRFDEGGGRHFRWAKRLVAVLAVTLPVTLMIVGEASVHSSHWWHGSTALSAGATAIFLWRMKRCPPHRWVIPAAALMLTAYFTLLDVVRRHERAMFGESTDELMDAWRKKAGDEPHPFYFTHAPAGLDFYLGPRGPARRLPIRKSDGPLNPADYVAQLDRHMQDLRGLNAFVMGNRHYLDEVPGSAAQLPGRLVVEDRKYAIFIVP